MINRLDEFDNNSCNAAVQRKSIMDFSLADIVQTLKDRNSEHYDNLCSFQNERSWLNYKSVSLYCFDNQNRVLLYRDGTGCSILPDNKLIVPVWGLCNENEDSKKSVVRIFKDNFGINLDEKKLKEVWGDSLGLHTSYCYFLNDKFEDVNFKISEAILSKSNSNERFKFESKKNKGIFYCSYQDVCLGLDSSFRVKLVKNDINALYCKKSIRSIHDTNALHYNDTLNSFDSGQSNGYEKYLINNNYKLKLVWSLHRPGGSTAIYNAFQHLSDKINKSRLIVDKLSDNSFHQNYDMKAVSPQSVFWTIINKGYFENRFNHLGKIGMSLSRAKEYELHSYIPLNSIPFLSSNSEFEIEEYKSHPNYCSENEKLYSDQINNAYLVYMANILMAINKKIMQNGSYNINLNIQCK